MINKITQFIISVQSSTDRVEIFVVILTVLIHRSHVTRHLVPLAVIVIGHHIDPVQVAGDLRHVVACVHDGLAGTDRRGQQQALWLEGC